ncbi:DUF6988 family protein [Cupriavidus plantarum]|uniref:DUF6988 family protein n=1 Tax=Cupriavidus plantarum TaxID=942865 RepID=UPI00339D3D25
MQSDGLTKEFENFRQWATNVQFLISHLLFPTSLKNNACVGYHSIALEHCQSIYRLLSEGTTTSGFALLRPQFDAMLRGLWVRIGWTTTELSAFLQGELEMPSVGAIISGLEKNDPDSFPAGHLSAFKDDVYSDLCDLTHGGAQQLRPWMHGSGRPTYEPRDVATVLRISAHLSRLSCRDVLVVAQDLEGQARLAGSFQQIYGAPTPS